jgi:hypothetical protein
MVIVWSKKNVKYVDGNDGVQKQEPQSKSTAKKTPITLKIANRSSETAVEVLPSI